MTLHEAVTRLTAVSGGLVFTLHLVHSGPITRYNIELDAEAFGALLQTLEQSQNAMKEDSKNGKK